MLDCHSTLSCYNSSSRQQRKVILWMKKKKRGICDVTWGVGVEFETSSSQMSFFFFFKKSVELDD